MKFTTTFTAIKPEGVSFVDVEDSTYVGSFLSKSNAKEKDILQKAKTCFTYLSIIGDRQNK